MLNNYSFNPGGAINVSYYFIYLGFYDLLPVASMLAKKHNYSTLRWLKLSVKLQIRLVFIHLLGTELPGLLRFILRSSAEARAERLAYSKRRLRTD